MIIYLLILTTAFLGSILAGLFGGGAGLIFTPAILLFLSQNNQDSEHLMQTSITTMITALLLSGLVACFKQHQYKHIDWSVVRWSVPLVVMGAIFGCYIMTLISSKTLTLIFAIATLILATRYIYKLYNTENSAKKDDKLSNSFIWKYPGSFFLGLICTISGAASFAIPYYEKIGLNIKLAIGTTTITVWIYSVFVAIIMIISGINQNNLPSGNIGYLNYTYLWLFIIPTVPGAMIGAKLSHFLPERKLKIAFTILMTIIGCSMLFV